MALIVEDGSGLANAESYVSVAGAEAYATARGLAFSASPADPAEQALRRATQWLDAVFLASFPGQRTNGRSQALQWPRVGAHDSEGEAIASDEIPVEIVHATIEAAVRELKSPGSLSPDVTPGKIKKSAKVGDIAVEYAIGSGSAQEQRPIVSVIDDILGSLLSITRGPALFGKAVRG